MMRPDFGRGVESFLFGSTDETTLHLLESNVEEAIRVWEPRVHEVEVRAEPDPGNPGKVMIRIRYEVRATNNLFNQVYPFYIHEGTK
ncbi:GPW/gp25 family protein [Paenibacillus sp. P25]|nr:GPW/gp25 family protein [Paenibacillus sp. P25]